MQHAMLLPNQRMLASYYRVFIDSAKLFFINVFLYTLFLEGYILLVLVQERFTVELPFVEMFYTWIATFFILVVWIVMASLLHRRTLPLDRLVVRTVFAELPFIVLIVILWIAAPYDLYPTAFLNLLVVFTAYMLLFPIVVAVAYRHSQAMAVMRRRRS